MSLGDFIDRDFVRRTAILNVQSGNVILCNITGIDHPKLFVPLSHRDDEIGGILINSNINWHVKNTTELAALQYPILRRHNGFLDHDSFADCSQLFPRSYNSLIDQLLANSYTHLGRLYDDDVKEIMRLVTTSPTISKAELKKFGFIL